ncbi:MAG: MFS transporter [Anaerolineaceae bacterium]
MPKTFRRDRETWFTFFLLAVFGYFLNILGPITPFLREELYTTYTVAGFHFSAFAIGMLVAGLLGDRVLIRFGYRTTLWASAAGICIGAIALILGRNVILTISASFFMGILGSFTLVLVPSMLSLKYKDTSAIALTELNTVASLVGMLAPLLVGAMAATILGWRFAVILSVFVVVLMGVGYRQIEFTTFPKPNRPSPKKRVRLPLHYWIFWLGVFLVVAVEFCFIFWGSNYLIENAGIQTKGASSSISLFLGAMLLGRWFGSRILRKTQPWLVLLVSLVLALAGFFLFWSQTSPFFSLTGFFLAGLGVANLYPISLDRAISSVPSSLSSLASARGALASASAILTLPLLLGNLADQMGMHFAFLVVPVLIILTFILQIVLTNKVKTDRIVQLEIDNL